MSGAATQEPKQLTDEQIDLIIETWKLVAADLEGAGLIMFSKLFEIAPELQDLFPFKGQELSDQNELLKKHAVQVMETVGTAIGIIRDQPALKDALIDLGIVHHMKSVKIDDFAPVGQALIYALSQGLKDRFTDKVKDAYVTFYGLVQHYMELGMKEGLDA